MSITETINSINDVLGEWYFNHPGIEGDYEEIAEAIVTQFNENIAYPCGGAVEVGLFQLYPDVEETFFEYEEDVFDAVMGYDSVAAFDDEGYLSPIADAVLYGVMYGPRLRDGSFLSRGSACSQEAQGVNELSLPDDDIFIVSPRSGLDFEALYSQVSFYQMGSRLSVIEYAAADVELTVKLFSNVFTPTLMRFSDDK